MGKWLSDGNLEFLGRIDTQVKIRGMRVETGEIENHLMRREDIKEAVVLAHEGIDGEKYLCAYVVPANGKRKPGADTDLKSYLSGKLPEYMIPSHFIELDAIPFTPTGKINREAFPEPGLSTKDRIPPKNQVEERLAEIWADILDIQIDTIGSDSNFFKLGGHSLKAMILVSKIHKKLNVKLPLSEVFKTPTIGGLSQYIKRKAKDRYLSIEPCEKKEYYALSSAQKRLYILQQLELQSTGYNIPHRILLGIEQEEEKFAYTFKQIIRRHESLRTSFEMINEEPVQRIHEHHEVEFNIDYYQCKGEGEDQERKVKKIIENFERPFDLSKALLLRVGLIKIGNKNHMLLFDLHHIITDGTSQDIL